MSAMKYSGARRCKGVMHVGVCTAAGLRRFLSPEEVFTVPVKSRTVRKCVASADAGAPGPWQSEIRRAASAAAAVKGRSICRLIAWVG